MSEVIGLEGTEGRDCKKKAVTIGLSIELVFGRRKLVDLVRGSKTLTDTELYE